MEHLEQAVPMAGDEKDTARRGGSVLKAALLALTITACAAGGAYAGLCAYATQQSGIWQGISAMGQDLSGLTVDQAAQKLQSALPEAKISVYTYDAADPNGTMEMDHPAFISVADLGGTVDTQALAQAAYDLNARGNFLTAGVRYLSGGQTAFGGVGFASPDPEKVDAAVEAVCKALAWDAQDTTYEIQGETLLVTMSKEGRALDMEQLRTQLQDGAWTADLTLTVPYAVTPPGKDLSAQEIHDAVAGELRNAGYDPETDTITPEHVGASFDVPAAQALMDKAAPGETVEVPAEIQQPAVTSEELKAVLFRDVLGEATTPLTGGSIRINNVRLSTEAISGTILSPGEVFSYNEGTGRRTAEKGYGAAPAYINGETVDSIGGGVCQTSSTLYLACLNSNLEIVERYNHRYTPTYIQWGMDATVSWGGPDYKFRNDTDYPIKIEGYCANGYDTIRILGTKTDDITVKMTNEQLSMTPYQVVYEDDPTLAPGEEVVKTTPYTGYRYKTYRNLYDGDGNLISSTYEATSDYKYRNKVIRRGPAPANAEVPLPENPAGPAPEQNPAEGTLPIPEHEPGGEGVDPATGLPIFSVVDPEAA